MRVLMTGTREWRDATKVEAALKHAVSLNELDEPITVMHFATNVVDGMVAAVAQLNGINVVEVAPNWATAGKAALYRLAEAAVPTADLVFTFGEDKVTEHIAAVANGSAVRVFSVKAAKPEVEVIEL